jgi:hypothetical protein
MSRNKVVPAKAEVVLEQYIQHIIYNKGTSLDVSIISLDAEGNPIAVGPQRAVTISGEAFADLMSEAPEWAPDKPAFKYTEEDLWIVIDKLDNGDYPSVNNGLI